MACLFTRTRLDDDGYPVRDPSSSSFLVTFAPAGRLRDADGGRGAGRFELAITGGTGKYASARGYATVVSANAPSVTLHTTR